MKRFVIFFPVLLVAACSDRDVAGPDTRPALPQLAVFDDENSSCTYDSELRQFNCQFSVTELATGEGTYWVGALGFWSAAYSCLSSKTGRSNPKNTNLTTTLVQVEQQFFESPGSSLSGFATLREPALADQCAGNKGPFTVMSEVTLTPVRWQIRVEDASGFETATLSGSI